MLKAYADHWGLITGASSGIGAEFARQLAGRGMHLVLVARRQERLLELAESLKVAHGTKCEIIVADLAEAGSAQRLLSEVASRGIEIELLVNNAGVGLVAEVDDTDITRVQQMLQLNIVTLTELTIAVVQQMLLRGHGGVINLASVVSFQPVGYMGAYAASKAFVLHFSEALWGECRSRGVTITALCPGTTRTEFFDHSGAPGWAEKNRSQDARTVVRTGLAAFDKRKQYVVSGWINYILSLAVRLAPRATAVKGSMSVCKPQKKE
ncbi:MAG: SDR family NAD(P)-dependent oxidoreductase [Planctomycetaceae bacterium]